MFKKFDEGDLVRIIKPGYETTWIMTIRESTLFGGEYSGYGIDITRDKSTGLYIPNKFARLWWHKEKKNSLYLIDPSELEMKSFEPYIKKMKTKSPPTDPYNRFDPEFD